MISDSRFQTLIPGDHADSWQSEIQNLQSLHSLHCRIPDELVKLKRQAGGNIVGEHPLRQFARVEQTVRSVASAAGVFGKGGRKQYCVDPRGELMARREISGELVVRTIAQHELDLVP